MADETWTIRRVLEWTRGFLADHGDEHARLSAEWLLSSVTGKDRMGLYLAYDEPLEPDELSRMHGFVARRAKGEPLQYIAGKTGFRFIEVSCEPGVLIPRPETEILVDAALEGVDAAAHRKLVEGALAEQGCSDGVRVLELGCGTGCIALSIADERPEAHVTATDISPVAVSLATRNCDALGLGERVSILECDLASGVAPELIGTFDVLVSNPPYIPSKVMAELPAEVAQFEPELALAGGEDGLDVFRRIAALAPKALAPGGMLAVELFEGSLDDAAGILREQGGWERVEVREDLTHRPRVLVAVLANDARGVDEAAEAPQVLPCDQARPAEEVVDRAAAVLAEGGVLVMPTDSVYGIGCAATPDNPGYRRIFDIKRRDLAQTLPLLVADAAELVRLSVELPPYAVELARRLWPGALTLVVRASDAVPAEYRRSNGTVALRLPDSPLVRRLARRVGSPLAVTSANTHGAPSPASSDALEPRIVAAADLTLACGATPAGDASTIVDCTGEDPVIVRHGAIADDVILGA